MDSFEYLGVLIILGAVIFILLPLSGFVWAAIQDWKVASLSMNPSHAKSSVIKTVYFYLVSIISLFMVVFATADLVNLGLKTWVFPKADLNEYVNPPCATQIYRGPEMAESEYSRQIKQCEESRVSEDEARDIRKQRDAVRDLAFLVVGIPLFAYHWSTIRRESREEGVEKVSKKK
jgi:hypothetical protein